MANYCCADFNTDNCNLEVTVGYLKDVIDGMKTSAGQSVTLKTPLSGKANDYIPTYGEIKQALPLAILSLTSAQNNTDGLVYNISRRVNDDDVLRRYEVSGKRTEYSGLTISNGYTASTYNISECGGSTSATSYAYKFIIFTRACGVDETTQSADGTLTATDFTVTGSGSRSNFAVSFTKNPNGSTRTASQYVSITHTKYGSIQSNTLTFTQKARKLDHYDYGAQQSAATDVTISKTANSSLTGCGNVTATARTQIKYETWSAATAYDTCGDRWSAQDTISGLTQHDTWTNYDTQSSTTKNGCSVLKGDVSSTWTVYSPTFTKRNGTTINTNATCTWSPSSTCATTCYGDCPDDVVYTATGGTVDACGDGYIYGTKKTTTYTRQADGSCAFASSSQTNVTEEITGTSASSIENNGTSNRTTTFYSDHMSRSLTQSYPCSCLNPTTGYTYSGGTTYISCSSTSYSAPYRERPYTAYTNCDTSYGSWSAINYDNGTCTVNTGSQRTVSSNTTHNWTVIQYGATCACSATCANQSSNLSVASSSSSSSKHGQTGGSNIQIGTYSITGSCLSISSITSNNTSNVSSITWSGGKIYATLPDKSGLCSSTAQTTITVTYSVNGTACTSNRKTFYVYQDANTTCPVCDCSTFSVPNRTFTVACTGTTNQSLAVGWAQGADCNKTVSISYTNTSVFTVSTGSSGTLIVSVGKNETSSNRSTTVTFIYGGEPCTAKTVTITQSNGCNCGACSDATVSTTAATWLYNATGSSNVKNIATATASCGNFTVSNVPSWLTTGTSGNYITAYPNASCTTGCTSRSQTLTISFYKDGSKVCDKVTNLTVTQNCSKTVTITANPSTLTCSGGTVTFSVS